MTPQKKIIRINALLKKMYGPKRMKGAQDPLDTLIKTILSQNTTDKNSIPAFQRLKAKFKTWEIARKARQREIETLIKPAGLFRQKAARIKEALNKIKAVFKRTSLSSLKRSSPEDAVALLTSLKGVGPKTIACVMLFSLKKPYFPVDTHILRVGKRLGLLNEKASAEEAHKIMKDIVPNNMMYEFHINMIEHGRSTCSARSPKCQHCLLRKMCWWYKKVVSQG